LAHPLSTRNAQNACSAFRVLIWLSADGARFECVVRARYPGHVIKALAVSGTDEITVLIFEMAKADNFSLHLIWTGTIDGPFKVYMSNSYNPNPEFPQDETKALNPGNWVDVTTRYTADTSDPGGGAGETEIHGTFVECAYLKVTLTPGSGSGVLDGYLSGKSL
jgi:hypothetical protein